MFAVRSIIKQSSTGIAASRTGVTATEQYRYCCNSPTGVAATEQYQYCCIFKCSGACWSQGENPVWWQQSMMINSSVEVGAIVSKAKGTVNLYFYTNGACCVKG